MSGFRAETLTSLGNASNFKRTHAFLMQVWEALYRHCLIYTCPAVNQLLVSELDGVKDRLLQCVILERDNYAQATTITERECDIAFGYFMSFLSKLANDDSTWKFWYDFMFHDYLAYVGLYLAIRGGMWTLRVASLKEMCPLFTA